MGLEVTHGQCKGQSSLRKVMRRRVVNCILFRNADRPISSTTNLAQLLVYADYVSLQVALVFLAFHACSDPVASRLAPSFLYLRFDFPWASLSSRSVTIRTPNGQLTQPKSLHNCVYLPSSLKIWLAPVVYTLKTRTEAQQRQESRILIELRCAFGRLLAHSRFLKICKVKIAIIVGSIFKTF